MNVLDVIAGCAGIIAAAGTVLQCILTLAAGSRAAHAGSGASISVTTVIQALHPAPPTPPVRVVGAVPSGSSRAADSDVSTMLVMILAAVLGVVVLYARYRPWVLLVVTGVIAVCLLVNVLTLGMMYQRKVISRGSAIGWALDALGYAAALTLILRLALRTTPYGDYRHIRAGMANGGLLHEQPDVLGLLVFEILALLVIVAVVIVGGIARLGLLSLVNAAARGNPPGHLARFAPWRPHAVWSGPVIRLMCVALAWGVSSLTLHRWIVAEMRLPF